MNFSYSEDQQAIQELTQKIIGDLSTHERLNEVEKTEDGIDKELWAELAKANIIGACLPESVGGMDMGLYEMDIVLRNLGLHAAAVPYWQSVVCAAMPIAKFGSEALQMQFLPGVVEGQSLLAAALHEPGSRNPAEVYTTATQSGDNWSLSGSKVCVSLGSQAERILVPATAGGKTGLFLVAPDASGVSWVAGRSTSRELIYQMTLDNAVVSEVLVAPGDNDNALQWLLDRATLGLCSLQVGLAERALNMTAEYAREREQFDRPIGSFQAVHTRAADAFVKLEAMKLTTIGAVHKLEQNEPADTDIAIAKYWCGEGGFFVTFAAQHLHGGIGVDLDYPVHRSYIQGRHNELLLGSAAEQLHQLGAMLAQSEAPAPTY